MIFPSTEFDDAVTAVCHGSAAEADLAALHAALRTDEAARDDYLWQVELQSYLASLAPSRITRPVPVLNENPRLPASARLALVPWAVAAAAVVLAFFGGLSWHWWNAALPDRSGAENDDRGIEGASLAAQGWIRETVRFASAADAPILVGTGRQEPIDLGAEVPYRNGGDTLHVWDWSQSKQSRVMKDIRLWPEQTFCVSPDGKQLVWAKGDVLNLTSGERSTIDLGGEFHVGHQGGTLKRIAHTQFTPDGRRLALLLSNLVLTKSSHPRRHDLSTSPTFQIVEFPSGKLLCEFPAGTPADLPLAFSADGKRAVCQYAHGKSASKIVERSALTGEVRREYEPALREYANAISLSADGSLLAVYDSAGDTLLWDTRTGKLKHKVALAPSSSSVHLRFSPVGKLLALSLFPGFSPKLILIDVADGTIVAKATQESSGDIHWSADCKSFDVLSDRRGVREERDRAGRPVLYNLYPSVRTWKIADLRKQ